MAHNLNKLLDNLRPSKLLGSKAGEPDRLSRASSFAPEIGSRTSRDAVRGYYIDFGLKTADPRWPTDWLLPAGQGVWVAPIQWGLGAYERYLANHGERWREGAIGCANYLVGGQERDGTLRGGWAHREDMRHTFPLAAPWISAMAQGEGASLLVRAHLETGDERFAESALEAMRPMRITAERGGVAAELDGGWFPEEYPTVPPSYVLNGALFALWGCHEVAKGLGDDNARSLYEEGIETLAANIGRFDLGYWSRYDLFPHPVSNVASSAYHLLHIRQLRATSLIEKRPELTAAASRFEAYAANRLASNRAFAHKVSFRLANPRNAYMAHRLPWLRRPSAA